MGFHIFVIITHLTVIGSLYALDNPHHVDRATSPDTSGMHDIIRGKDLEGLEHKKDVLKLLNAQQSSISTDVQITSTKADEFILVPEIVYYKTVIYDIGADKMKNESTIYNNIARSVMKHGSIRILNNNNTDRVFDLKLSGRNLNISETLKNGTKTTIIMTNLKEGDIIDLLNKTIKINVGNKKSHFNNSSEDENEFEDSLGGFETNGGTGIPAGATEVGSEFVTNYPPGRMKTAGLGLPVGGMNVGTEVGMVTGYATAETGPIREFEPTGGMGWPERGLNFGSKISMVTNYASGSIGHSEGFAPTGYMVGPTGNVGAGGGKVIAYEQSALNKGHGVFNNNLFDGRMQPQTGGMMGPPGGGVRPGNILAQPGNGIVSQAGARLPVYPERQSPQIAPTKDTRPVLNFADLSISVVSVPNYVNPYQTTVNSNNSGPLSRIIKLVAGDRYGNDTKQSKPTKPKNVEPIGMEMFDFPEFPIEDEENATETEIPLTLPTTISMTPAYNMEAILREFAPPLPPNWEVTNFVTRMMEIDGGYFTTFVTLATDYLSRKNEHNAKVLTKAFARQFDRIMYNKDMSSKFGKGWREAMQAFKAKLLDDIKVEPGALINYANITYKAMITRKQSLSYELNMLLTFIDSLYTPDEATSLARTVELIHSFPRNKNYSAEDVMNITLNEALTKPFTRLASTIHQKLLVDAVNGFLNKFSRYFTNVTKSKTKMYTHKFRRIIVDGPQNITLEEKSVSLEITSGPAENITGEARRKYLESMTRTQNRSSTKPSLAKIVTDTDYDFQPTTVKQKPKIKTKLRDKMKKSSVSEITDWVTQPMPPVTHVRPRRKQFKQVQHRKYNTPKVYEQYLQHHKKYELEHERARMHKYDKMINDYMKRRTVDYSGVNEYFNINRNNRHNQSDNNKMKFNKAAKHIATILPTIENNNNLKDKNIDHVKENENHNPQISSNFSIEQSFEEYIENDAQKNNLTQYTKETVPEMKEIEVKEKEQKKDKEDEEKEEEYEYLSSKDQSKEEKSFYEKLKHIKESDDMLTLQTNTENDKETSTVGGIHARHNETQEVNTDNVAVDYTTDSRLHDNDQNNVTHIVSELDKAQESLRRYDNIKAANHHSNNDNVNKTKTMNVATMATVQEPKININQSTQNQTGKSTNKPDDFNINFGTSNDWESTTIKEDNFSQAKENKSDARLNTNETNHNVKLKNISQVLTEHENITPQNGHIKAVKNDTDITNIQPRYDHIKENSFEGHLSDTDNQGFHYNFSAEDINVTAIMNVTTANNNDKAASRAWHDKTTERENDTLFNEPIEFNPDTRRYINDLINYVHTKKNVSPVTRIYTTSKFKMTKLPTQGVSDDVGAVSFSYRRKNPAPYRPKYQMKRKPSDRLRYQQMRENLYRRRRKKAEQVTHETMRRSRHQYYRDKSFRTVHVDETAQHIETYHQTEKHDVTDEQATFYTKVLNDINKIRKISGRHNDLHNNLSKEFLLDKIHKIESRLDKNIPSRRRNKAQVYSILESRFVGPSNHASQHKDNIENKPTNHPSHQFIKDKADKSRNGKLKLRKISESSSYSDDEYTLKLNLKDAMLHPKKTTNGRKSIGIGHETYSDSRTDEQTDLNSRIYHSFALNPYRSD